MKLRNLKASAFAVVAILAGSISAFAADSDTQTVSFEVAAINEIALSGSPSLVISSATAGSAPNSTTANATYAITTNESNRKITAAINSNMPSGVTLSLVAAAPSGGTSTGSNALSTTAVDLVTGISTLNEAGLNLQYTLAATSAAGVVPAGSREVTLTITAGAE